MTNNLYTIPHLPLGTYTVTESNNIVENFAITTTYSVNNTATSSVVLSDGTEKVITVADAVNKLEATLSIEKVWTGDDSEITSTDKNAVVFTVTGPKQNVADALAFSRTFTYADMTNGVMTYEHLTLGTYSVVESNNTFADVTVTTTYEVDNVATNEVVLADGDDATITVTNTCVAEEDLEG
jgi:hypothetical protein